MSTKQCFKCKKEKDLSEFYKHNQMKDGHLNKCKECNKIDAINTRNARIEHYREYDRKRGNRQDNQYMAEYREKYPNKYKAHTMVNNAIKSGKLFHEPCEVCNTVDNVHAHHDDYLRPLNIRWLCAAHHSQWHRDNGEALNAE